MNVLVISVHPDDETLGCGGTILKHAEEGDRVFWLILTDVAGTDFYTEDFINRRDKQIQKVVSMYGFDRVYRLGFPTTKLHEVPLNLLIAKISEVIHEVKPQIVYSVNRADIHTDHQVASKAIMSCTKSFRYPFIRRVLMYECISETEMAPSLPENLFIANVYSDITGYLDRKIEIMRVYEEELKEPPFPRSIENICALARYRGSTVGVHYAEAFMLIRDVF